MTSTTPEFLSPVHAATRLGVTPPGPAPYPTTRTGQGQWVILSAGGVQLGILWRAQVSLGFTPSSRAGVERLPAIHGALVKAKAAGATPSAAWTIVRDMAGHEAGPISEGDVATLPA